MPRELTVTELRVAFRERLAKLTARPYSAEGDALESMTRKVLDALTSFDMMTEQGFAQTPDARIVCDIADEPPSREWIKDNRLK